MTTPIGPSRRPQPVRRTRKSHARPEDIRAVETPNLPVPVTPAASIPPGSARPGGDAALHAQVIGEKRGLRAGPTIHDQAKATYNQTEWSGTRDRRAPKGGAAKTKV
jgi:hypothetical protein